MPDFWETAEGHRNLIQMWCMMCMSMGSFVVSGCSVSGTTSLATDLTDVTDLSQESRKKCPVALVGKWDTFYRTWCVWPSNLYIGMTTSYSMYRPSYVMCWIQHSMGWRIDSSSILHASPTELPKARSKDMGATHALREPRDNILMENYANLQKASYDMSFGGKIETFSCWRRLMRLFLINLSFWNAV